MIHATVIGNLGRDAEIKVVGQGKTVMNISVATKGRDKDGATTWVRGAMWGQRAEKVTPYLKKGGRVAISGTLTSREHEGKTYLELDIAELELLGDRQTEQRPASSSVSDDPSIPF